ncbi:MAG: hypothetical protein LQ340_001015 [Diploschistes diacapsis]|nr:MAG: hypothetical protein LQ340_001015 [Diploschistes diacapsis]
MAPPSKRGLAWPTSNKEQPFLFTRPGSKVSWLYNWSPDSTAGSSMDFVPMQWNHVDIDRLHDRIEATKASAILAFNEPELRDQANMPASLAAREWLRCIEPLRQKGIRCGSPGISSAPQGVAWLQDFIQQIRAGDSDVDFYAFHWYGETLGQFYDYIWSTHHRLGPNKPVWITEFAPTNWNAAHPLGKEHVENFIGESCAYLDTLDWVERYAWFGAMSDTGTVGRWAAMLGNDGQLTEAGRIYCDR